MNQIKRTFLFSTLVVFGLNACKDDKNTTPDPTTPPVNETELITTVKLMLYDTANSMDYSIVNFYDPDGVGGNGPQILDTIILKPNKVYAAEVMLLDDSKNPADTISNEVKSEGADHLLIYTKTGVNLTVSITDKDKNNLPLGLTSYWFTGAASTGTATITLKHQPGVKNGTATPGTTDVMVTFPCKIR